MLWFCRTLCIWSRSEPGDQRIRN